MSATSGGYALADEDEDSNIDTESQEVNMGLGGRGTVRKRKAVVYDDGLSDAQFVDFIERGGHVSSHFIVPIFIVYCLILLCIFVL